MAKRPRQRSMTVYGQEFRWSVSKAEAGLGPVLNVSTPWGTQATYWTMRQRAHPEEPILFLLDSTNGQARHGCAPPWPATEIATSRLTRNLIEWTIVQQKTQGYRLTLPPRGLNPGIVSMASRILTNRRWESMPILADAMEEAGFEDEWALSHCRSGATHCEDCPVLIEIVGRRG